MSLPVTFRTYAEETPTWGQRVMVLRASRFYNTISIHVGTVDHVWDEYDADGNWTGGSAVYHRGDEVEDNTGWRLGTFILLEGERTDSTIDLDPCDMWCPFDPVEEAVADLVDKDRQSRSYATFCAKR